MPYFTDKLYRSTFCLESEGVVVETPRERRCRCLRICPHCLGKVNGCRRKVRSHCHCLVTTLPLIPRTPQPTPLAQLSRRVMNLPVPIINQIAEMVGCYPSRFRALLLAATEVRTGDTYATVVGNSTLKVRAGRRIRSVFLPQIKRTYPTLQTEQHLEVEAPLPRQRKEKRPSRPPSKKYLRYRAQSKRHDRERRSYMATKVASQEVYYPFPELIQDENWEIELYGPRTTWCDYMSDYENYADYSL